MTYTIKAFGKAQSRAYRTDLPNTQEVTLEMIKYYTVNQVCSMLSIGRTKLYELMNAGDLQSITIGSARRIPHSELLRFHEVQPLAA